ncbi:ion transporter [Thiocystis violacea]|uniref:ion transporter n=1 Tax=Thiocystis violacea TaxID=13725 RepID=UPI001908D404|nr:ion transporter [Thiocystis violacea]MBK1722701.1 ion transporter [Thiocystis violacea]
MTPVRRASAVERVQERPYGKPETGLRLAFYRIIFEADTRAGRAFDLILLVAILLSVSVVVMDSVAGLAGRYHALFRGLEWCFTGLFTLEYAARLWCVRHPTRYARSFFGIVDLVAVLPSYLALLLPGAVAFQGVRLLRLLRIFRILKLTEYVAEYRALAEALRGSARKIFIFLSVVMITVLLLGTAMYVVEGPENGYTSIPTAVYWAIVTMTTVGYGDVTPHTDLGKLIASAMMLIGWGILAVPTGIVTAEMTALRFRRQPTTRTCPECLTEGHEPDAAFCKDCGARLPEYTRD